MIEAGMDVRRERISHGFARLTVSDGTDVTEVDLGVDARIRPAEPGPYGPTLALEELAADKLVALFDRAQARDFIDVDALVDRFGLERLCQLAGEKDRGFSRSALREALGSFGRFTAEDLGTADNDSPPPSSTGSTRFSADDRLGASTNPTQDSHSDRSRR